jgi:hypothetical protein
VVRRHLAATAACAILALLWTYPLAWRLSTHLPGAQAGDNVTFAWNVWWMRAALGTPLDFFHTTYLFAPVGADLTLHTHTALPAFAGATAFRGLPVIAALNATTIVSLFLNALCAYLLAWRLTQDSSAALIAGVIYGGSPFIAAHLHGHFNLTTAWTIPLFALACHEAMTRRSLAWSAFGGLLLGATAYIDYYFVVYEAMLGLCLWLLAATRWSVTRAVATPASRRWARLVAVVMFLDAAIIAAVAITGGFALDLGAARLSMRSVFNPLQLLWALVALWLCLRLRPRVAVGVDPDVRMAHAGRAVLVTVIVFVATAAPILWHAAALTWRGEYVTQRYFWRSAPKGVDFATLALGNPFHGLWGEPIRTFYRALGIDALESTAWLGLAPVGLVVWGAAWARNAAVRCWMAVGALFFIWALGPHLMVFGWNTGLVLPQAIVRYVPILSNARVPGRAMVVVFLALGVLAACAIADWRRRSPRPSLVFAIVLAIIALDYVPAPFPIVALERPGIYERLRDRPEPGALCELPMGLRDGFGQRGLLDDRVLYFQTIHGRPITGGFIARLPPSVVSTYEGDPLLSSLLRLSGPPQTIDAALPDRQLATRLLETHDIRFVMLNRATAPSVLIEYVEKMMPLTLIAREGERSLYVVDR